MTLGVSLPSLNLYFLLENQLAAQSCDSSVWESTELVFVRVLGKQQLNEEGKRQLMPGKGV